MKQLTLFEAVFFGAMAKTKTDIKGTVVLSSKGKHNFAEDDKKLLKGVEVKNRTNTGHLNIDRSEIVQQ